jgi:hypothetical protein
MTIEAIRTGVLATGIGGRPSRGGGGGGCGICQMRERCWMRQGVWQ